MARTADVGRLEGGRGPRPVGGGRRVMTRAMSRGLRTMGSAVGVVLAAAILAACAAAPQTSGPRKMKQEDFKMLAGQWLGDSDLQGERSVAIQGVIYENGSFFIAPRGGTTTQMPGQMKIVNEAVVYETPTSEGKMTFEEAPAEWVWKWDGKTKIGDRAVRHVLRKSK